jgi:hypothetical protein
VNILYGIDPLDEIYAPNDEKPSLASLILGTDRPSRKRRSILAPLVAKCLERGEEVVFYGYDPYFVFDGSKEEIKKAVYAQEHIHKTHSFEKYEDLIKAPETRDSDIIIAASPSYNLTFYLSNGNEDFYKKLKALSRELNKKIVVIADNIDDIIISKRHADITTVLVDKLSKEDFANEVAVDAMVYYKDHDIGKLELEEFDLSYDRSRCMWTGDLSWKKKSN